MSLFNFQANQCKNDWLLVVLCKQNGAYVIRVERKEKKRRGNVFLVFLLTLFVRQKKEIKNAFKVACLHIYIDIYNVQ
jgi:hypothetical protein